MALTHTFSAIKGAKALQEAAKQITAASTMLDVAARSLDASHLKLLEAITGTQAVDPSLAAALSRLADKIIAKEMGQ